MQFWLKNEEETRTAGAALAASLLPLADTAPIVVFIRGNLGAGKSTLVRGFLTQAGIKGVMPSPTYSLVEPYTAGALKLFHMDAYRMADGAELDYLGLDDMGEQGSILLVEWPDHIKNDLPCPTVTLDLEIAPRPGSGASSIHPDSQAPVETLDPDPGQEDWIDPGRLLSISVNPAAIHAQWPRSTLYFDTLESAGLFRVVT